MNQRVTQKRISQRWLLAWGLTLVAASGCGGAKKYGAVVTGTVTIDGELAHTGTVTFHPADKSGKIAVGRIYPDGSFSLRTGQGNLSESDGGTVAPGDYVVTVEISGPPPEGSTPPGTPPVAGPLLIDQRYINVDTSDLKYTVAGGENVVAFDLKRAAPAEEAAASPEANAKPQDQADEKGAQQGNEPAKAEEPAANGGTSAAEPPAESTAPAQQSAAETPAEGAAK